MPDGAGAVHRRFGNWSIVTHADHKGGNIWVVVDGASTMSNLFGALVPDSGDRAALAASGRVVRPRVGARGPGRGDVGSPRLSEGRMAWDEAVGRVSRSFDEWRLV
jgi:hypothetical protein